MSHMVWIDIETTGLLPSNPALLEVGVMVTNAGFQNLGYTEHVIKYTNLPHITDKMDDYVKEMHTESGLIMDLKLPTNRSLIDTQDDILSWLFGMGLEAGTMPMCGSSVQFDRTVLARWMPKLEAWFHYRNIDVSTVKELCQRWYPEEYAELATRTQPFKKHRPISDIMDSIAELNFYRDRIFRAAL